MVDRPTVRLRVADPDRMAARVATAVGVPLGADGRTVALANAVLSFEAIVGGAPGPTVEVEPTSAVRAPEGMAIAADGMAIAPDGARIAPDGPPIPWAPASVDAIGWATVDLERAASELGASDAFAASGGPKAPDLGLPGRDPELGGRLLPVGRPSASPFDVVLLEPDSEGALAAALARHGEGPAVVYVRGVDRGRDDATHVAGSRFGPWVVVRGSRTDESD